ncbi:MAG: hypothetical protein ACI91B_005164 [Planctomycetota bacterium]
MRTPAEQSRHTNAVSESVRTDRVLLPGYVERLPEGGRMSFLVPGSHPCCSLSQEPDKVIVRGHLPPRVPLDVVGVAAMATASSDQILAVDEALGRFACGYRLESRTRAQTCRCGRGGLGRPAPARSNTSR